MQSAGELAGEDAESDRGMIDAAALQVAATSAEAHIAYLCRLAREAAGALDAAEQRAARATDARPRAGQYCLLYFPVLPRRSIEMRCLGWLPLYLRATMRAGIGRAILDSFGDEVLRLQHICIGSELGAIRR
jgi:hypothetical protein